MELFITFLNYDKGDFKSKISLKFNKLKTSGKVEKIFIKKIKINFVCMQLFSCKIG